MRDILPELNGKDYIDRVYEMYDVHFCKKEEVDELIQFLDEHWKPKHIFVLSRELFDWQHYNKVEERYNYVVAKSRETGEIHSALGFIPTSQFDPEIKDVEIWPCIWKSRDDIQVKGLGVTCYHYLKTNYPVQTISILGITPVALSIYKHWNFTTGKISHFYMLNAQKKEFKLIEGQSMKDFGTYETPNSTIEIKNCSSREYQNLPDELFDGISKFKSKKYYENRFFNHPIYQYEVLQFIEDDKVKLLLFVRENLAEGTKCLRVVDVVGDFSILEKAKSALQDLLVSREEEYIDWVEVGLDEEAMKKGGFLNKADSDIVIPNYFEPFKLKNVDLDYAYKTVLDETDMRFSKADADQDRPNSLPQ